MEKKEYITYGLLYDSSKFVPIENKTPWKNKPYGGFWASPVNSEFGWKDWCFAEEFRTDTFGSWTKFRLKKGSNVLKINSVSDFLRAVQKYELIGSDWSGVQYYLDFEKMLADGVDAVFLTAKGNSECHLIRYRTWCNSDLNLWDCESMVVLNKDVIEVLELHGEVEL